MSQNLFGFLQKKKEIRQFIDDCKRSFKNYSKNEITRKSAALSFYSITGIVPFYLVLDSISQQDTAYTFFNLLFPGFAENFQIYGDLAKNQMAYYEIHYPSAFLTIIATGIIVYSLYDFFNEIGLAINHIWGIEGRSYKDSIIFTFHSVIFLSFFLYLCSCISNIPLAIINDLGCSNTIKLIICVIFSVPFLLLIIIIAFYFIPYTKKHFLPVVKSACLAALCICICELVLSLTPFFISYQFVYSSIASIIIILFTINFFWRIILSCVMYNVHLEKELVKNQRNSNQKKDYFSRLKKLKHRHS